MFLKDTATSSVLAGAVVGAVVVVAAVVVVGPETVVGWVPAGADWAWIGPAARMAVAARIVTVIAVLMAAFIA
jgi:hypothetical protein